MRRALALSVAALAVAAGVQAQGLRSGTLTTGVQFQGYNFDDELGVEAANLLLIPIAYQVGVGNSLSFDLYSAYARGATLVGGTEYTLSGPVDTRVRANYALAPWAVVTLGLNLPTGAATHDSNEARVAAALASELFGFREASFGLGFGATTGIATVYRVGSTGVGFGASYRLASEFEPSADSAFKYTPGNEMRLRLGVDRDIGANKLTAGVTWQNFARDQLDGQDLFQAGNRWRGDLAYSFRTSSAAAWTAYLTNVWRERGDVGFGNPGGTTTIGTQNLLIAGVSGSWNAGPTLTLQPVAEFRMLSREAAGGEGWLAGAGTAVPMRFGSFAVTPSLRIDYGSIQGEEAIGRSFFGGDVGVTIGFGGR